MKHSHLRKPSPLRIFGKLSEVRGSFVTAKLGVATIGQRVRIFEGREELALGEVVGFDEKRAIIGLLEHRAPLSRSNSIELLPSSLQDTQGRVSGTTSLSPLGSLLNYAGEEIAFDEDPRCGGSSSVVPRPPRARSSSNSDGLRYGLRDGLTPLPDRTSPHRSLSLPSTLQQEEIQHQLFTGITALDLFTPIGFGQRLLILARPGVGKSTLIGMIARGVFESVSSFTVDVNVIALIGERRREVGDFVRENRSILPRSIIVSSTSEESALARVRSVELAFQIAESYRDCGARVLLQVDSLTRLLRAYRELGLAAGELPIRQGYPPSVFGVLPKLTERAGAWSHGSITAIFTLLLSGEESGDSLEDPMVEEIRSLTDGHILLSQERALAGQYPAIDLLRSLSRLAPRFWSDELARSVSRVKKLLYRLEHDRELFLLSGRADPELQIALQLEAPLRELLTQRSDQGVVFENSVERLKNLLNQLDGEREGTL